MRFFLIFSLILFIIFSLTAITTNVQMPAITDNSSLNNIYKQDASPIFQNNSSFYYQYSFHDNPVLMARKFGHFILYGTLAAFIFIIVPIKQLWRRGIIAISLSSFIGLLDEVHQHFLINRSGRILDVYVNTAGSISFVLLTIILYSTLLESNRWFPHNPVRKKPFI